MNYEMACEDFPNVHIASLDFQELHLQEVEPTSLSPNERHQLDEVIINYAQLFEATGPPTPIVEHHIHTGTSSPVSSLLCRITPGRQKILEQEVHLLETGDIEECESTCCPSAETRRKYPTVCRLPEVERNNYPRHIPVAQVGGLTAFHGSIQFHFYYGLAEWLPSGAYTNPTVIRPLLSPTVFSASVLD
jgi:hypothetical protein